MKVIRKTVILSVFMCLLFVISAALPGIMPSMNAAAANEGDRVTVSGSLVNVRSDAGTGNKVVTTANKGDTFPVLGTKKDGSGTVWYHVYTSSGDGYVISTYSKVSSGAERTLTVTANKVNVRSGAGTDSNTLTQVNKNNKFTVLGSAKDSSGKTWYKIYTSSGVGYIIETYSSVSGGSSNDPAASPTTADSAKQTLTVNGTKVNVRSGADKSSKVVYVADKGQSYEVLGSAKDSSGTVWYKISAGGKTGYIVSTYVKVAAAPASTTSTTATTTAAASPSKQVLTVTGTKVNVRSGADRGSKVVYMADKGQTYDVLGSAKDSSGTVWYKITAGGKTGYIVSTYVKVATVSTKATTAATTSPDNAAPPIDESSKLTVTGTIVNVRSGAGTDKKVVTTVLKNQTFNVEGTAKDSSGDIWYKITAGGKTGYVVSTYVKVAADPKTTAAATTTTTTTAPTTTTTAATTTTTTTTATTTTTTAATSAVSGTDTTSSATTTTTAATTTTASSTTAPTSASATGTMATTTTTAVGHGSANIKDVTYGTVKVSNTLNVRQSAKSDAKILGTLKNGAKVTITQKLSGWYKINYGSDGGYVASNYITNVTTNKELVSLEFKKAYYVCNIGATVDVGIAGNGMTVTYSSADTKNAPITDKGIVTGKTPGIYAITAKCGNLTANCDVVVTRAGYNGMQPMTISAAGTKFIAEWEGGGTSLNGKKVFYPYKDIVGYWTIGYGHAKTTTESKKWSKERAIAEFNKDIESLIGAGAKLTDKKNYLTAEEAEALLYADLNKGDYAQAVNGWMVRNGVKLNQQQFDALVSFCYNLGPNYWNSDTYMFYLKAAMLTQRSGSDANKDQIIEGFCRYIKASGLNVKGLWYRRRNEAELFLEGDYKLDRSPKFPLPSDIQWDK